MSLILVGFGQRRHVERCLPWSREQHRAARDRPACRGGGAGRPLRAGAGAAHAHGPRSTRPLPYRYHLAVPSTDPKLDLIAAVPLFSGLNRREVEFLGKLMDDVDVSDGKVLTREGATGGEFFIVLEGTVRIERGGNEVNRLGEGDFLGEIALIDQGKRTATAI